MDGWLVLLLWGVLLLLLLVVVVVRMRTEPTTGVPAQERS
jgi:hypothetical protein